MWVIFSEDHSRNRWDHACLIFIVLCSVRFQIMMLWIGNIAYKNICGIVYCICWINTCWHFNHLIRRLISFIIYTHSSNCWIKHSYQWLYQSSIFVCWQILNKRPVNHIFLSVQQKWEWRNEFVTIYIKT